MVMSWLCSRNDWLCTGYYMVCPGYDMVMSWLWHGYDIVMTWLCTRYDMVMSWLCPGYDMVMNWLCTGYDIVMTWLYDMVIWRRDSSLWPLSCYVCHFNSHEHQIFMMTSCFDVDWFLAYWIDLKSHFLIKKFMCRYFDTMVCEHAWRHKITILARMNSRYLWWPLGLMSFDFLRVKLT